MKLGVISSAPFVAKDNHYLAYSPYVKEIELWAKHSDVIAFCCPVLQNDRGLLISSLQFPIFRIFRVREFNIKSVGGFLNALRYAILNFYMIFKTMYWADHIHLRCPGNIPLMGCMVQVFFPHKPKTTKYAGNWNPNDKQPFSYRVQKWILNNTFLTRNMQVLVYGEWEGSSRNIKPFFTATYKESDKKPVIQQSLSGTIQLLFVGTLSEGKRPLYAVQLAEKLHKAGHAIQLSLYGEGKERQNLENYIKANHLQSIVVLKGNQNEAMLREAYCQSHFLILASKSEGWPKVVAEAMFWGCVPLATEISCVATMLGSGQRGLLLSLHLESDVKNIENLLADTTRYHNISVQGMIWSRQYTLELFEEEIKNLIKHEKNN